MRDLEQRRGGFLKRGWILHSRAFCGLDARFDEDLLRAAHTIAEDEALLRLAWHCKWRLFDADETHELQGWPRLEPSLGKDNGLFNLLVGLAMAGPTRKYHEGLGIPESVTRDTCRKVLSCCWMHEVGHEGRPGIQRQRISWLRHYVREPMFRIGGLEYWLKQSPVYPVVLRHKTSRKTMALLWDQARVTDDGCMHAEAPEADTWEATVRYDGDTITGYPISPVGRAIPNPVALSLGSWERVIRPEDKVLQVHIPFGSSVSIDAVRDSFAQAVSFFQTHFANESPAAFASTSWLFSPLLHTLLGPDTNVTRFQRELYLYPIPSNNRSGLSFIFPEDRFDPATASRRTRLQRGILDLLNRGERWHLGGMFYLLDDLDHFGSQHYLKESI